MRFDVITIFPALFEPFMKESLIGKAIEKGLLRVCVHDLRRYAADRHRVTDDYPYGGGAGMVMKPEPIFRAVDHIREMEPGTKIVLMSPQGLVFNQAMAAEMAAWDAMAIICGRYEGVDERVVERLAEREVSIGDYVLNGGEVAAMALMEAVSRLVPGVVGREESTRLDSFVERILDYPHYTRPAEFRGLKVPEVLLSGDHRRIARWRRAQALRRTMARRPDLIDRASLSAEDRELIEDEDGRRET